MDRRISIVLALLLAIALMRYVIAAFFVHPFADDFSYAVAGMRTELLPRLWDEYHLWNGRWFSNILVLRGPLVLGMEKGLWLYRLVPVLLLVLTWCGAFALLRAVAPAMSRSRIAIGASLFLMLYVHLMPDLSEGLYWYTGAVSYQLPGALMLFLLAGWVRAFNWERPTQNTILMNAVLALVICGCSELHMVFMVLLHGALLFFRWRAVGKLDRSVLIVLVVALVAAAVMLFAPGNAGRGGQFPRKHELWHSLGWGAAQTVRFLGTWILSPALLLVSVLYLAANRWLVERVPLVAQGFGLRPWTAMALLVVPVSVAMVLPYWATGLLGQHRTVNAALLFALPLWFVALTSMDVHWLRQRKGERPPMPARLNVVACFLLAVVVFVTGSGGRLTKDLLSGDLLQFDEQLNARYARIEEARDAGSDAVHLDTLAARPRSLRYLDGSPDPGEWINRSIAYYFRADTMEVYIGEP